MMQDLLNMSSENVSSLIKDRLLEKVTKKNIYIYIYGDLLI